MQRVPCAGDDSSERQPERKLGKGGHEFDETLDDVVGNAAVVAGNNADDGADHDADDGGEEAEGKGDAPGGAGTAPQVSALFLGAQQVDLIALANAEQMPACRDQAQDLPFPAADKELDLVALGRVLLLQGFECLGVDGYGQIVDKRTQVEVALGVDQADAGGRNEAVLQVGVSGVDRREELGEQGQNDERQHHQPAGDRGPALPETLPDELEVGLVLFLARVCLRLFYLNSVVDGVCFHSVQLSSN